MTTPRTSIIMPVYNTGNRVVESIRSVLAQTDPDFELLVLIDASPDDASERISDFLQENPDKRVRVFDNPVNRGVSAVRNQGLDEARGEWIAFLDSDDSYQPLFLEKLHAAASLEGADIAICAHTLVEIGGNCRERHLGDPGTMPGKDATLALLKYQLTPFLWDKLFSAHLLKGVHFAEDIYRAEDALFVMTAFSRADKVTQIADSCYNYTVDTGGLTWGRVAPVEESIRVMEYTEEAVNPLLGTAEGRRAYDVSWIVIFLNNAQQGLMASSPEGDRAISACRAQIRWGQILNTARAGSPVFAAAACLLKLSPALYKILYGAYVKKMYGI